MPLPTFGNAEHALIELNYARSHIMKGSSLSIRKIFRCIHCLNPMFPILMILKYKIKTIHPLNDPLAIRRSQFKID